MIIFIKAILFNELSREGRFSCRYDTIMGESEILLVAISVEVILSYFQGFIEDKRVKGD